MNKMVNLKQKIGEILSSKKIDGSSFKTEDLYKAGMENVKNNIEFYHDKTYTCESVITELFIRGVNNYLKKN
jgi:hypothetical protein